MKTINSAIMYTKPQRRTYPANQYGCTGHVAYGMIIFTDGSREEVKNPDYKWPSFTKRPTVTA